MEIRAGAVVADKLRLLRPLGQGGMGVVWAAQHLTLDVEVAVKFIRPERAAVDPGLLARFEREAKATARIVDPHVVTVMDYGSIASAVAYPPSGGATRLDGVVPYIVMELLRGAPLAELIERGGRLSFASAMLLLEQVGSALSAAHACGVVHRDIKPQNVFITEGGRDGPLFVKVLDFGVAKTLGDAAVPEAGPTLTQTGTVLGSAPYMSPEQLEGRKDVDLRSDLWSLAVVLYECLTGAQPFTGSSFVSVGAAVLRGRYAPVSASRPMLPAGVDDWFAKALSLDPDDRFTSARAMVDAFAALAVTIAPSGEEPEPEAASSSEIGAPADALVQVTSDHRPVAPPPAAVTPVPSSIARRPRSRAWIGLVAATSFASLAALAFVRAPRRPASCPRGMVLVEGATFSMGSPADAETPSDETPAHAATVPSFCLDATEVSVRAYLACASCERPSGSVEFEGLTPRARVFESQFCDDVTRADEGDHPINCVDWSQAKAFCAASNKRLPTEAEWELAARGAEGRMYPWGSAPPSSVRLNACGGECSSMLTERRQAVGKGAWPAMYGEDDGAPSTAAVGRYPAGATPAGILDLAGNVWEWTSSAYCPYGHEDCGDSRRVVRGGGWDTTESQDVRAARRYPSAPSARGRSIGFRCAATP